MFLVYRRVGLLDGKHWKNKKSFCEPEEASLKYNVLLEILWKYMGIFVRFVYLCAGPGPRR